MRTLRLRTRKFVAVVLVSLLGLPIPTLVASQRTPRVPVKTPDAKMLAEAIARGKQNFNDFKKRRAGTYERAMKAGLAKGWKPTEIVTYVEVPRSSTRRTQRPIKSISTAGQNEFTSDGEFWSWAWDDGNPDTWEGTIVLVSYITGEEMEVSTQICISCLDVWYDELTYYDGGWAYPTWWLAEPPRDLCVRRCLRQILLDSVHNVGAWCLAAGFGCGSSGPGYFACLGIACSGFSLIYLGKAYFQSFDCIDACVPPGE